jgi:hypothetical protein
MYVSYLKPYVIGRDRIISTGQMSYDAKTKTLVCEASDVQFRGPYRLFNDACDVGVHVQSHKTLKVKHFGLIDVDMNGDDIAGWRFECEGVNLLIIND